MDPSYVQFISSLMGEDAFELPSGRRPSLGGYPGMGSDAIGQIDDCTSLHPSLCPIPCPLPSRSALSVVSENSELMRERGFSFSRDRGFSWDAGFEDLDNLDRKDSGYTIQDIIQSIGRKRTMSGDVNFNFIPMPVDSIEPFPASDPHDGGMDPHGLSEAVSSTDHVAYDPQQVPSNKSNVEPNYFNMMPLPQQQSDGSHGGHMMPQGMTMDPATGQMHGMPMQLLRPMMPGMGMMQPQDDSMVRVGAYTKEERQIRIAKFRAKKNRRVWKKQIKYDCRKKLADNRPRIKGRFVTRKDDDDDAQQSTGEGTEYGDSTPRAAVKLEGDISAVQSSVETDVTPSPSEAVTVASVAESAAPVAVSAAPVSVGVVKEEQPQPLVQPQPQPQPHPPQQTEEPIVHA